MNKEDILENKKAYNFSYDAHRKNGKNISVALRLAQLDQQQINKRAAEKLDSKNRTPWPTFPRAVYYCPANKDGYRWVENASQGLRFTGKSHDIIRLDHSGWYCDSFQGDLAIGSVYQLPSRKGVCLYFPAVLDPYNPDCALIDFSQAESEKESAARCADSMAEAYAEDAREYDAKNRAEQETEELQEQISNIRRDIIRACKEARALRDSDVCERAKEILTLAKKQAERLLDMKKAKQDRIEALQDNFWLAVEY